MRFVEKMSIYLSYPPRIECGVNFSGYPETCVNNGFLLLQE
jgi:hypothetical protein